MISHLKRFALALVIISAYLLLPLTSRSALAETYSSNDYSYPSSFDNNIVDYYHNDMSNLDAVNFENNEMIFFTVVSNADESYDSNLYYYVPGPNHHGYTNITDDFGDNFSFKLCAFNDVLYIFYVPSGSTGNYSPNTIYYRTFTIDYSNNGWQPTFSSEKALPTGASAATIGAIAVLNGEMYLIYTGKASGGYYWYYTKTSDGVNFSPETHFYTNNDYTLLSTAGAVFQVPDVNNGAVEKMMILYAVESQNQVYSIKSMFFDGTSQYGLNTVSFPSDLLLESVKLIYGSANGYNDTKYSLQAFLASYHGGGGSEYSDMYHAEYIPDGPAGDQGSWSSTWTKLSNSSNDTIKAVYATDSAWAVMPTFAKVAGSEDIQESINIWYGRGTNYKWPSKDYVQFRRSTYLSDYLVQDQTGVTSPVDSSQQDFTSSTVIGVIQGPPPWPLNGHPDTPYPQVENISVVQLGQGTTSTNSTTITAVGSVVASYGKQFLKAGISATLTAGLKYTHETGSNLSITNAHTFTPYTQNPPDDEGLVLVFSPQIYNTQYILKAYDKNALQYGSEGSATDNEFTMSVIEYGPAASPSNPGGSTIVYYPYQLTDPSEGYSYSDNLTGMAPIYPSTDIVNWASVVTPQYANPTTFSVSGLTTMSANVGSSTIWTLNSVDTTGSSYAPSAMFSVKASLLGFTTEETVSFGMKISTSTAMKNSIGFNYTMLSCSPSEGGYAVMSISPVLLIPNGDDTGYGCPWISDDIRNFQKPKPWSLSYQVYPGGTCDSGVQTLSVWDPRGTFQLDRARPRHDRMKVVMQLKRLPSAFSLAEEKPLYFRFGGYALDTRTNPVISRVLHGNVLTIQMGENGNLDAAINLVLTHHPKMRTLTVAMEGVHMNMSGLYDLPNRTLIRGKTKLPFDLFIADGFYADGDLRVLYTGVQNKSGNIRILGISRAGGAQVVP